MNDHSPSLPELAGMIADHMEKGFLENIADMFKHDPSLYSILPDLITDERLRVRIGTTALLETLKDEDRDNIHRAVPVLLAFLYHADPNFRGDAAYILGLIGNEGDMKHIEPLLNDPHNDVRTIAEEAISEIKNRASRNREEAS